MPVGKRISIVLTALWTLSTLVMANSSFSFDWNLFFTAGVMPAVAFWGGWWIFLGFKSTKTASTENVSLVQIENSTVDLLYEEKLKRFGLQKNKSVQPSSIVLIFTIFTTIGFFIVSSGGVGNKFDLAVSMGYNLSQAVLFTGLYCFGFKIQLKSKQALMTFLVIYCALMMGHFLAFS